MAPKGATLLFLLIIAGAALAEHPDGKPEKNDCGFRYMVAKLTRKCLKMGYLPETTQLKPKLQIFNNSDLPPADKNNDPQVDKMTNEMWNISQIVNTIKRTMNSSAAAACYMQASVAPLSWATVTTHSEGNMTSDDYDTLLSASKPLLLNMPHARMDLPNKSLKCQKLEKMMKMLKEVHSGISPYQRTQVVKWVKQQITDKNFNCTMKLPSDSRPMTTERRKPSHKWLSLEALMLLGPYISDLAQNEVDFAPKDQLCKFFSSGMFKDAVSMASKMKPSLGKKLFQKFQECFSEKEEYAKNVDKLGVLARHYLAGPDLTPELSMKVLSELNDCDDCDGPRTTRVKKLLVMSVISNTSRSETLRKLGRNVAFLPSKRLSGIPKKDLKELLKNLGPTVKWTRGQQRALVQGLLCQECKDVSTEELMAFQSLVEVLPRSFLKRKAILKDRKTLEIMSMRMRKWQLMSTVEGLFKDKDPSEMVQDLDGPLLSSLPLNKLEQVKLSSYPSLDQMLDRKWSRRQAAFLAKRIPNLKTLKWRLRSVLKGVTCEMIDKVADDDAEDMAQAITETPQWLSKMQAGCAARKLFGAKEKERADYFKTITEEELKRIPTHLLLHLPPLKVKGLPDSVCPVFLDKMEEADLSSLPRVSPSRPALVQRALLCLTTGTDFSELSDEDMSRLGPLLCELRASQLSKLAPAVLKSSLQAMASCQHIPRRHRADLIQLVRQTFGDPSSWSAETMEELGCLVLLDDKATSALPSKPWVKDVLQFLKSGGCRTSDALRRKLFNLTTAASNAARKKRANEEDGIELRTELIEELGMDNVYWTDAQLRQMSNQTFHATVETLGAVPDYSADQQEALTEKATEAFGPVSQMDENVVMQMGCIPQGYANTDLETLPFSLDNLEEIGKCGWKESQMRPVWKAVAKHNNLTAQQLGAADMAALSQFICGLNTSEFRQLNMSAFKDAVGVVGAARCSSTASRDLKSLAVSAFGNPNTWTEARVSELGNIVAGLTPTEFASLDSSVFSFLSTSSIPLMPHLDALSVAQLEDLGPDNADMVTSEQRGSLNKDQIAALDRAVTGSPDQTQKSDQSDISPSDAPSLSVNGIWAFMKPVLLLLTGVLLL